MDFRVEGEGAQSTLVPYLSAKKASALFAPISEQDRHQAQERDLGDRRSDRHPRAGADRQGTRRRQDRRGADGRRALAHEPHRRGRGQGEAARASRPRRPRAWASSPSWAASRPSSRAPPTGSRTCSARRRSSTTPCSLPARSSTSTRVVGQRTADTRVQDGARHHRGGKLEDTLGGGICQVATTLFNAVFFAGLDVTARTNHSLYISHYPKGRDATVSWGGPALRLGQRHAQLGAHPLGVLRQQPDLRRSTARRRDARSPTPPATGTTSSRIGRQEDRGRHAARRRDRGRQDSGQTGRSVTVKRTVTQDGKVIHQDIFAQPLPDVPADDRGGQGHDAPPRRPSARPRPSRRPRTTTTARRDHDHHTRRRSSGRPALAEPADRSSPRLSRRSPLTPDASLAQVSHCSVADSPADEGTSERHRGRSYERIACLWSCREPSPRTVTEGDIKTIAVRASRNDPTAFTSLYRLYFTQVFTFINFRVSQPRGRRGSDQHRLREGARRHRPLPAQTGAVLAPGSTPSPRTASSTTTASGACPSTTRPRPPWCPPPTSTCDPVAVMLLEERKRTLREALAGTHRRPARGGRVPVLLRAVHPGDGRGHGQDRGRGQGPAVPRPGQPAPPADRGRPDSLSTSAARRGAGRLVHTRSRGDAGAVAAARCATASPSDRDR